MKRGVELSVSTIIIVILALVCLVVVLFIFSSGAREFASNILQKLKEALGLWNRSIG